MKVNKTNALAFLSISIMLFGGAYTFNWVSNSDTGLSIEYLPGNSVESALNIPELVNNPKIDKVDPVLANWLETGVRPDLLNTRGSKTSVLFFTAGDPTLNGAVNPTGYFSLGGSINYVQAYVDGVDHLRSVVNQPGLIRVVADFSTKVDAPKGTLDLGFSGVNLDLVRQTESVADVGQLPESFKTREILDVAGGQALYSGADGSGVTVNVHDTGVDVGHAALMGTLATKTDGSSAAFDGTGDWFQVTNKYSEAWYDNVVEDAAMADVFSGTLVPTSGSIDLTGYGDLVLYNHLYGPGFTMADIWTGAAFGASWAENNITSYDVTGLPGATTGYYFGITWVRTGNMHMMIPFVLASSADNGVFDRVYHDWDTGFMFAMMVYGGLDSADFTADVDFSFADEHTAGAWNDAADPYLSHDFLLADGETAGTDNFPELSLGGLGNSYDVNDNDWDDNTTEVFSGVHADGWGFAYISDYDTHGTGVAGSIAAQDVDYAMYSNVTDPDRPLFSIQGVAPGAKILPSTGLLSTSGDIWAYLWASGFEPLTGGANAGNWTFVGDHQANISSNSWGFLSFYDSFGDDQVHGFDLYSLFMELLGTPNALTGSPGILFVISAGNTGNGYGTMGSPEPLSGILVGASTNSWWRANASADDLWANDSQGDYEIIGFSSAGPSTYNYPKVDIVNVGAFDYSTAPTDPIYAADYGDSQGTNNSYQLFGGTSQAAPYTSAVMAYIFEAYLTDNPLTNLGSGEAKTLLKSGAVDLGYDVYRQGAGHASISGSLAVLNNDATKNHITNTAFPQVYKDRLDSVMAYYFGEDNWYGISDSMQAGYTAGHTDTAVAFGSLMADSGDSGTQTLTSTFGGGDTISGAFYDAKTYEHTTAEFEAGEYYTYHSLADNFTLASLTSADFVQFVLVTNQDDYAAADASSRLWIVNAQDDNSNGEVDDTERELLTYGYNDYHQVLITVSASQLGADTYLAVRDGAAEFGTNYTLTAIAYTRTTDLAVDYSGQTAGNHPVFIDTTGLAPGFYSGYLTFTNGGMAQYTYSIAYEAEDFDATASLGTGVTARDVAFDNSVLGAVSLSGRRQSGDWRFYDIYAAGDVDTRTLAVEVNWTNAGTVLDAYLFNYTGSVLAHSNPVFGGDGLWNSYSSGQGNANTKLIANVTDYNFAGEGAWFTLALHAVIMNSSLADPVEDFTFGAAFLDADVGVFETNYTFERSGTPTVDEAGNPVTDDTAGISWSSASGGNPIARFGPEGTQTSLAINSFTELSADGTMTSPAGDGGAFTSLLFVEEVFLTEGMSVQGELEWTHDGSDVDMILVAKGDAYDYDSGVCGAQAASASNPELFACGISATGTYEIVATYYDGPGSDIDWELEFFGLASVVDTVDPDTSAITLSLQTAGVADATYLLTSSTGGYNGGEDEIFTFTYDHVGPALTGYATTPEGLGVNATIGEIYDAGEFTLTLTKGSEAVLTNEPYGPGNHPIEIPSTFMNFYGVDTVFTYTATDEFDRETTGTITIYRDDATVPEFNSVPADVEVKKGATATLSWDIADSSGGDFRVLVNGVEDTALGGTWTPGVLSIDVSFDKSGEYFLKLEVYDALENGASDTVKVTVPGGGSDDDGFLPFNFIFAIVAIPVLVTLRRKFNK